MSDFDPMVEVALSMYLGETCPYCKVKFEALDDLKLAVYNGYTDYGRIAHRACFVEAHPDFNLIIKMGEENHLLREEHDRLREENERYLARIEELTKECNFHYGLSKRMKDAINDLYDQCDAIPHASDCDPKKEGYCTCARGNFNSVLVSYHTQFEVD